MIDAGTISLILNILHITIHSFQQCQKNSSKCNFNFCYGCFRVNQVMSNNEEQERREEPEREENDTDTPKIKEMEDVIDNLKEIVRKVSNDKQKKKASSLDTQVRYSNKNTRFHSMRKTSNNSI